MKPRYAILLDGGFVLKKLEKKLKHFPTADDVVNECERIRTRPELSDYELLRIYFYHAPPCGVTIINPIDKSKVDLSKSATYAKSQALLDSLEMKNDFALRLGETSPQGWRLGLSALKSIASGGPRVLIPKDLVPDVNQKGVDLRIGLDLARLALRELVRVVVVVTGDSDMIPAFKFARREGVRVYLDHMGHRVKRDLQAHTDLIF
jgi:uncharacterized LabA/DUF88 family protein